MVPLYNKGPFSSSRKERHLIKRYSSSPTTTGRLAEVLQVRPTPIRSPYPAWGRKSWWMARMIAKRSQPHYPWYHRSIMKCGLLFIPTNNKEKKNKPQGGRKEKKLVFCTVSRVLISNCQTNRVMLRILTVVCFGQTIYSTFGYRAGSRFHHFSKNLMAELSDSKRPRTVKEITFVTGNKKKLEEVWAN